MGVFITFEGGEGCGKSYQSKLLYRLLVKNGIKTILTHEPGGTVLGEKITKWLKWHSEIELSSTAELLLFSASRAQLCKEVITPALDSGYVVVCDRYIDSSLAYQGFGRGLDLDTIKSLISLATDGLKPDLTILLDIPVAQGFKRKNKVRRDRFENEQSSFHEKVRQGYRQLARLEPQRFLVLDATLAKENLSATITQNVMRLIGKTKT
ncbi:MAG: dTMP kinase [Dehalococcoidia bacterium]|nr:dTMP kinase [Dehalococcoidia bacterium]